MVSWYGFLGCTGCTLIVFSRAPLLFFRAPLGLFQTASHKPNRFPIDPVNIGPALLLLMLDAGDIAPLAQVIEHILDFAP